MQTIDYSIVVKEICERFSDVIAIYLFGSYYNGHTRVDSDLDIAVLFHEKKNPVDIWDASRQLAYTLNIEVDLVQLNTASTVFRYVILSESKLLYCSNNNQKDYFEMLAFSMYLRFNEARQELIQDLLKERNSK